MTQVIEKTRPRKTTLTDQELESFKKLILAKRKDAEEHSDLVVMATHGHSGLAHLLLGSTAEKVTQYVRKPVITVRPDKKQFKKEGTG